MITARCNYPGCGNFAFNRPLRELKDEGWILVVKAGDCPYCPREIPQDDEREKAAEECSLDFEPSIRQTIKVAFRMGWDTALTRHEKEN